MKKILFALMLSLGLAQVAPVVAAGEVKEGRVSKAFKAIKNNKKALIVGLSFLAVAGVAGVDALAIKKGWDNGYNKAAYTKAISGMKSGMTWAGESMKFWGKGWKKNIACAAIDATIIYAAIEIGMLFIKHEPKLTKTLISMAKSLKTKKANTAVAK